MMFHFSFLPPWISRLKDFRYQSIDHGVDILALELKYGYLINLMTNQVFTDNFSSGVGDTGVA